ncbi:hypothetical protein LCGC14_0320110 [marine sediment metagenome]|uniref:Uncharacterized protein n=1 Tax=marine sediment metagenome TaxID=412755 RepID=A0A0F9WRL7_9ZZZZ
MGWRVPRPAPVYNPRMSIAGAGRLIWYKTDPRYDPDAIRRWILRTDVEDLADLVLDGVDLDRPPMDLVSPLPYGATYVRGV